MWQKSELFLALYSALMWCAQPLVRIKLAVRGRHEVGYATHVEERFGRYKQTKIDKAAIAFAERFIWIHAVSLGETRAAAVLIAQLRAQIPQMKLLLTHGTATGLAEGAKLLQAGDVQVWQAWDTPAITQRFIQHFQPRIGILMETELWPNMAHTCVKLGVPLVIANARMSAKTYRKTVKFDWIAKGLAKPAYQSLSAVWAQSAADAQRFEKLGARHVQVFGNLKFDAQVDTSQLAQGCAMRARSKRAVVMLASSREGEELMLLKLLQQIQKNKQNMPIAVVSAEEFATNSIAKLRDLSGIMPTETMQWLIVPRHPQRFDDVAKLIEAHGFKVSRRSQWLVHDDGNLSPDVHAIWLGDSLGDMALYYGMSDVALLGGSFEPLGGQNLIEAAACGCPVVMGPSVFNFAQAAQLSLQAGAAVQVQTMQVAIQTACEMIQNDEALQSTQKAALAFATAHQGVAVATAESIVKLLG